LTRESGESDSPRLLGLMNGGIGKGRWVKVFKKSSEVEKSKGEKGAILWNDWANNMQMLFMRIW
jgi:hypothetical protein